MLAVCTMQDGNKASATVLLQGVESSRIHHCQHQVGDEKRGTQCKAVFIDAALPNDTNYTEKGDDPFMMEIPIGIANAHQALSL